MSQAFAVRPVRRYLPKQNTSTPYATALCMKNGKSAQVMPQVRSRSCSTSASGLPAPMRARGKPADGLVFDPSVLSRRDEVLKKAFVQLKTQQAELDARNGELT